MARRTVTLKKGPTGPRRALAGKSGTNKSTPTGGAGTSGMGHESSMTKKC